MATTIKNPFNQLHVADSDLNRVQDQVRQAFQRLVNALNGNTGSPSSDDSGVLKIVTQTAATDVTLPDLSFNDHAGYVLHWELGANGSDVLTVRPNNDASNGSSVYWYSNGSGLTEFSSGDLRLGDGTSNQAGGVLTMFKPANLPLISSGQAFFSNGYSETVAGRYTQTNDVTSLVVHCFTANGIPAGSVFLLVPIN